MFLINYKAIPPVNRRKSTITSLGDLRRFSAGEIIQVENVTGKGHRKKKCGYSRTPLFIYHIQIAFCITLPGIFKNSSKIHLGHPFLLNIRIGNYGVDGFNS